ncbi:MAG: hypothetical protein KAH77_12470, partial [Thiomargarita sp.]|nr:hypothetical protein [Thiomargarita sp.]
KCTPLVGVAINFGNMHETQTNQDGKILLPKSIFADVMNASMTLTAKKDSYIGLRTQIPIMVGTVWKTRFVMTKDLSHNQARFTLEWQKFPRDLDLHLVGTKNGQEIIHISYRNLRSATNLAKLDRDDTNSFGPETITLLDIKPGVQYTMSVHSYSGERFTGHERVSIYLNNRLKEEIVLPQTRERWMDVVRFTKDNYQNLRN